MKTDNSLTMLFLRVWMWAVPILMLVAAVVFGAIAVADESWGLLGVMVVLGLIGAALAVAHYWLLYRFGKGGPE